MTDSGVLVLSGPPCSGKSSVGRSLPAHWRPAPRPGIYIEVGSLFSLLFPTSDRSRDDRLLAYQAAHLVTRTLVERGKTVVLECTYARLEQRASLVKALADVPAPLWVVEFWVSPETAAQRFQQRREATDLDEGLVRERAEGFPYFEQAVRMTTETRAPDDLGREITEWLQRRPRPVQRESWAEAGRGWD